MSDQHPTGPHDVPGPHTPPPDAGSQHAAGHPPHAPGYGAVHPGTAAAPAPGYPEPPVTPSGPGYLPPHLPHPGYPPGSGQHGPGPHAAAPHGPAQPPPGPYAPGQHGPGQYGPPVPHGPYPGPPPGYPGVPGPPPVPSRSMPGGLIVLAIVSGVFVVSVWFTPAGIPPLVLAAIGMATHQARPDRAAKLQLAGWLALPVGIVIMLAVWVSLWSSSQASG